MAGARQWDVRAGNMGEDVSNVTGSRPHVPCRPSKGLCLLIRVRSKAFREMV